MSLLDFFSIQRIFFVLGGGFHGIYNILLTDRCWSADGNGVILSTAWRSYKVGISYRLITFLFVNLFKVLLIFAMCRIVFLSKQTSNYSVKKRNFEIRRPIVNDKLEKLLIEFLKKLH